MTGIDVDPHKVELVNRGESYIGGIPVEVLVQYIADPLKRLSVLTPPITPLGASEGSNSVDSAELDASVSSTFQPSTSRIEATTDFSVLADCDIVSIVY